MVIETLCANSDDWLSDHIAKLVALTLLNSDDDLVIPFYDKIVAAFPMISDYWRKAQPLSYGPFLWVSYDLTHHPIVAKLSWPSQCSLVIQKFYQKEPINFALRNVNFSNMLRLLAACYPFVEEPDPIYAPLGNSASQIMRSDFQRSAFMALVSVCPGYFSSSFSLLLSSSDDPETFANLITVFIAGRYSSVTDVAAQIASRQLESMVVVDTWLVHLRRFNSALTSALRESYFELVFPLLISDSYSVRCNTAHLTFDLFPNLEIPKRDLPREFKPANIQFPWVDRPPRAKSNPTDLTFVLLGTLLNPAIDFIDANLEALSENVGQGQARLSQFFQILKWLIKRCAKFDEVTFNRIYGLFEKIVVLYKPEDDNLTYSVRLLMSFPTELVADKFDRICVVCFHRYEKFFRKLYCPILKRAKTFDSCLIVKTLNCSGYFSILQNATESGTGENLRHFAPTLMFVFAANSAVQQLCRDLFRTLIQRADWSAQFLIPVLLPHLSKYEFEEVVVWMTISDCGEVFPILSEFVKTHGIKRLNISTDRIVEAVNRSLNLTF
jgi:hypothetical protein